MLNQHRAEAIDQTIRVIINGLKSLEHEVKCVFNP